MKINRIELFLVKIPMGNAKGSFWEKRPYFLPNWIPGFRQSEVRFYLLKLTTDSGLEGYAATTAMGKERIGLGDLLGNYLLGINPLDINLINQRIQEISYLGMRNPWIDAAVWDIIGKAKKQPLWKLLGGEGGYIYPYASTGENHGHNPALAREIVRRCVNEGYRGVKLRVKSKNLSEMLAYVEGGREGNGEIELMVDANQGWPVDILDETPKWTLDFAISFAQGLEPLAIRWLEEPLNRGDFKGLAYLRTQTKTPIAGGEMNSSWSDFQTMLDLGSLDIYQPDACIAGGTYAGGISEIYWLIKEIKRRNEALEGGGKPLKYSPHTWTTGLGLVLALHMVGLTPQEKRGLFEYPLEGYWDATTWGSFLKNDLTPDKEGKLHIPETPGIGVEIDWKIIERFGKRIFLGTEINTALRALWDRGLHEALYLKGKKAEMLARSQQADFTLPKLPF